MMLTTILLLLAVILLIIVIVLQVTGWPEGGRHEPDATGKELRRDLAELRAEMMRHLHAIRGDIEDMNNPGRTISGLVEQTERITALLQQQTAYNRRGQKRKFDSDAAADAHIASCESCMEETVPSERETKYAVRHVRQLTLFPAATVGSEADAATESGDSSEFISVPAADIDPDLDPPYDPDADSRDS
ncbi:MAG: hypothetical protein K4305_09665 [Chlorobium sp.]|uniref:hypothetical protein n=1 Tax=Chlorobium sp. TaxID=1095 RepID=UPI002F406283